MKDAITLVLVILFVALSTATTYLYLWYLPSVVAYLLGAFTNLALVFGLLRAAEYVRGH